MKYYKNQWLKQQFQNCSSCYVSYLMISNQVENLFSRRVKLLTSIDISTCAPCIKLNEQYIMAYTSTIIVLGCKIPHELDALKWKATGRRRLI
jgi:hypothetical protein